MVTRLIGVYDGTGHAILVGMNKTPINQFNQSMMQRTIYTVGMRSFEKHEDAIRYIMIQAKQFKDMGYADDNEGLAHNPEYTRFGFNSTQIFWTIQQETVYNAF